MKNLLSCLAFALFAGLALVAVAGGWFWIGLPEPVDPGSLPSKLLGTPDSEYAEAIEGARVAVRQGVAEENLPGLSIAVGIAGELVWAEGFGWADRKRRRPVDPTTLFRIGSVSKPLTAAAVGLLVERSSLDLDAPVRRYVPEFPEKRWPFSTRQAMGHVAGVRHPHGEHDIFGKRACATTAERLAIFADDPLRFEPGLEHYFSTYGWVLVGAVVEAAAGEPYLSFVQREIFESLGMEHTVPDAADPVAPGRATFYWPRIARRTRLGLEAASDADVSCILPAAGFLSTPSDLVLFGMAMLEGELLQEDTVEMLWTPLRLETGAATEYGLGWAIRTDPVREGAGPLRIVGHGGHAVGGTAVLMTFPEHGLVIATTTNVSFGQVVSRVSARVGEIFLETGALPALPVPVQGF